MKGGDREREREIVMKDTFFDQDSMHGLSYIARGMHKLPLKGGYPCNQNTTHLYPSYTDIKTMYIHMTLCKTP